MRTTTGSLRSIRLAALAMTLTLIAAGCDLAESATSDCMAIVPSQLPSGADPGDAIETVSGGARALVWGEGKDRVEVRIGLSNYADGLDRVIAEVQVRGEPGLVSVSGIGAPEPSVDWDSDCQYSMSLAPEMTEDEIVAYAERF